MAVSFRRVLFFAFFSRISCLFLLFLLTLSFPEFDTSTDLLFRPSDIVNPSTLTSTSSSSPLDILAEVLIRWDSHYFLASAERGKYETEQELAFPPGVMTVLRFGGWLFSPPEEKEKKNVSSDTTERNELRLVREMERKRQKKVRMALFGSGMSILAGVGATGLLYQLSQIMFQPPSVLSIPPILPPLLYSLLPLSPASQITPYTEPFHAFFAFLGMVGVLHLLKRKLNIVTPQQDAQKLDGKGTGISENRYNALDTCKRIFILSGSAISFTISTFFRSNGIMLGPIFFGWLWLVDGWMNLQTRSRLTVIGISTILINFMVLSILSIFSMTPFLWTQWKAYEAFCSFDSLGHGDVGSGKTEDMLKGDSSIKRPWCGNVIPSVYGFVQEHYWDVGFLRYWTLSQLPNFLLALPALLPALYFPYSLSRRLLQVYNLQSSIRPQNILHLKGIGIPYRDLILIFPILFSHLVLTFILIFNSHVQISLRFAATMPGVWVGMTSWIMDTEEGKDNVNQKAHNAKGGPNAQSRIEDSQRKGKRRKQEQSREDRNGGGSNEKRAKPNKRIWFLVGYCLIWQMVSLACWAGFYPPA